VGSASCPGRILPPGKTRYPLYRRLGVPQGRSGQVWKISPPPGCFFCSFCPYFVHFRVLCVQLSVLVVSYCVLWIFPLRKIRRLRSGANPQSWVPEDSTQTPRPPKPLIRSPDRPVRSQSLYRLSYRAHGSEPLDNIKCVKFLDYLQTD
jgi:hypothetical protein